MLVLHIAPTPFFADRGCHIRIRNEIEALRDSGVRVILCTYHLGADPAGIDIRRTARIPGYTRVDAGFSPFRFPADILLVLLDEGPTRTSRLGTDVPSLNPHQGHRTAERWRVDQVDLVTVVGVDHDADRARGFTVTETGITVVGKGVRVTP